LRWVPVAIVLCCAGLQEGVVRADFTAADCNDGTGACFQPNNQKRKMGPAQDPCKNGHKSGDPVDTYSGAFVYSIVDLSIPGRGLDVAIKRTYRNSGQLNGAFGYNWTFGYYMRARKLTSGNYLILGDEGHELILHAEGTNSLGENSYCGCDVSSHLVEHGDGTLSMIQKDGGRLEFDRDGALTALKDRFGDVIRFEYLKDNGGNNLKPPISGKSKYFIATGAGIVAREDQLVKIIDTYGREILLSYYGAVDGPRMGRLKQISDFTGRVLKYDYDGDGNLTAVTAPGTVDFPMGTMTRYTYSADDPNEALNHNLLTIVDGRNRTVLTNHYDSEDHVIAQEYGGSTTTWSYDIPGRRTVVTDGDGNTTETLFDQEGRPFRTRRYTRGLRQGDPAYYDTLTFFDGNGDLASTRFPLGNELHYVHSPEGDLLAIRRHPDATIPSTANDLVITYTYDPLYHQLRTWTDARGFTTTRLFDYQEAADYSSLASLLGISPGEVQARLAAAQVPMNLGDINGDGRADQIVGRAIKEVFPSPTVDGALQTIERLYRYNGRGQILAKRDAEGTESTFEYYPSNDPDGDGQTVPGSLETGHEGYLQRAVSAAGTPAQMTATIAYDAAGNTRSVTDLRNDVAQFEHDASNRLTRIVAPAPLSYETLATYDAAGNVVQVDVENKHSDGQRDSANPWITTTVAYDDWSRVQSSTLEIDPTHSATTQFTLDAVGNVVLVTHPEGNTVRYEYDERGKVMKIRQGYGSPGESVSTAAYDLNGNLSESVDSRGHATEYVYDRFDRVVRITRPLGQSETYTYDADNNVIATSRRGAGDVSLDLTSFDYDELGRLSQLSRSILGPDGLATGVSRTTFVVDRNGRLRALVDPLLRRTEVTLDALGWPTQVQDPAGDVISYVYESGVLANETWVSHDDRTGALSSFTLAYQHDPLNRLTRVTDAASGVRSMLYDSRSLVERATEPSGDTASATYDGLGRLRTLSHDLRGPTGGIDSTLTESRSYDRDSRITDITDARGTVTHYTYDALDRVTTQTSGLPMMSRIHTFTYDTEGNRLTHGTPRGVTTSYSYDDLNRLTAMTTPFGVRSYQYDALDRLVHAGVTEGGMTTSSLDFTYDSLGHLLTQKDGSLVVSTLYDIAGNRSRLTYPGGGYVNEGRTPIDGLATVRDDANHLIAEYHFAAPGRISRRTLGNGIHLDRIFDVLGFATDHTHTSAGGATLQGFAYAYDRHGDRVFEARGHEGGGGDVYHYDSVRRLKAGWFSASAADILNQRTALDSGAPLPDPGQYGSFAAYTLDAAGNRLNVTRDTGSTTYAVNGLNEYLVANGAPVATDSDGNLVDDGTFLYEYDDRNLVRVRTKAQNTLVEEYSYDALGRRVRKHRGDGSVTTYLYDRERLIEERDSSGQLAAQYVYGADVDEVLLMRRGGQEYYFLDNDLHSVTAATDGAGALVESYAYDHYGLTKVRNAAGTLLSGSAIGNPWQYAGRYLDPETGLYQYRARYLNTRYGRFMSADPIGYNGGLNLFAFANNNPFGFRDPLGLNPFAGAGMPIRAGLVHRPMIPGKSFKEIVADPLLWRLNSGHVYWQIDFSGGSATFSFHPDKWQDNYTGSPGWLDMNNRKADPVVSHKDPNYLLFSQDPTTAQRIYDILITERSDFSLLPMYKGSGVEGCENCGTYAVGVARRSGCPIPSEAYLWNGGILVQHARADAFGGQLPIPQPGAAYPFLISGGMDLEWSYNNPGLATVDAAWSLYNDPTMFRQRPVVCRGVINTTMGETILFTNAGYDTYLGLDFAYNTGKSMALGAAFDQTLQAVNQYQQTKTNVEYLADTAKGMVVNAAISTVVSVGQAVDSGVDFFLQWNFPFLCK